MFTYFNLIFLVLAVLLGSEVLEQSLVCPGHRSQLLGRIVQEVRSRQILRQMQFLHIKSDDRSSRRKRSHALPIDQLVGRSGSLSSLEVYADGVLLEGDLKSMSRN